MLLQKTRALAAARFLFWLYSLLTLGLAVTLVSALHLTEAGTGYLGPVLFVLILALWSVTVLAAARACKAAKYLRGPRASVFSLLFRVIRPSPSVSPVGQATFTIGYRAFISYSHNDDRWSRWLHKALESYRVPKELIGIAGHDGPVVPQLYPIFRDREELPSSADLGQQIETALQKSAYLIVICSPSAAASRWVNQEILVFKQLGREQRILPVVIDGEPNGAAGCFPQALMYSLGPDGESLNRNTVHVAADARPEVEGKEATQVKLAARLLGIDYDLLKHHELDMQRKRAFVYRCVAAAMVLLAALTVGGGILTYHYMLQSEEMDEAAVGVADGFVGQGLKLYSRLGVSQATIQSFLVAADRQLATLYELGVQTPRLKYHRAFILVAYADHYAETGDKARARACSQQAMRLMEDLVRGFPRDKDYQRQLAVAQSRVAKDMLAQGQYSPALELYRAGLTTMERLAASDPGRGETQRDVSFAQMQIGGVFAAQGQPDTALLWYRASLAIRQRFATSNKHDLEWRSEVSESEQMIGDVLMEQGKVDPALASLRASLEIRQRLAALDPRNTRWQHDISVCEQSIGHLLERQAKFGPAADSFSVSLAVMRRLGASDPGNAGWQNDIALINQDLAIVLAERGQIGEALESHREGLAILRRLAASDPGNPQLQNKLAISLLAGAHLKRMQGDVASARADYAQALAILRNLVAQYPQDATWRSQLDTAESVLNLDKGAP